MAQRHLGVGGGGDVIYTFGFGHACFSHTLPLMSTIYHIQRLPSFEPLFSHSTFFPLCLSVSLCLSLSLSLSVSLCLSLSLSVSLSLCLSLSQFSDQYRSVLFPETELIFI